MKNESMDHFFRGESSQFGIPIQSNYEKLTKIYNLNELDYYLTYEQIRQKYENDLIYNPEKYEGNPYKVGNRNVGYYGGVRKGYENETGDRHPDSILKIEPDHEMIYVFGNTGGGPKSYNPQKVEGKAYNCKRGKQTDLYRKTDTVITTNKGDRHPDSILKIEPDHEMVYVFGNNSGGPKTYNPQKVEGKPYKTNGRASVGIYRTEKDGSDSFRNDIKIDNKGDRHPDSILKIKHEPYEDGVYEMVPNYRIRGGKYNDSPYGDFYNTKSVNNDNMYHPSSILEFKNPNKPVHRTQKPTKLYEWLIKSYSNENDTVLDFCSGSGTCAIACKNTNRKFICIEKDEEIFNLGKKRFEEHIKDLNRET